MQPNISRGTAFTLALLLFSVALSAFTCSTLACAVPHGGCRPEVCDTYAGLTLADVYDPNADYSSAAAWSSPKMNVIGYVLGRYNQNVNGGSYDRAGVKDTPGLNVERFDFQPAFATAGVSSTIQDCCHECAKADNCWLFQFFPPGTPAEYGNGTQCYLLSGGTETWDWPEKGTPYAGSARKQSLPPRSELPISFVGGRCNGTGVNDDPHFTGARGTRYDFNGEIGKSYCLTTDEQVQINALLKGYKDEEASAAATTGQGGKPAGHDQGGSVGRDGKTLRTWIRELAVLWKDGKGKAHSLHLVARPGKQQERGKDGFLASVTLDGRKLPVPNAPATGVKQGDLSLTFLGSIKKSPVNEIDEFSLTIKGVLDLSLSIRNAHPSLQAPDDAEAHFNLLINSMKMSEHVHGVLGQTYRNTRAQNDKAAKFSQLAKLLGAPIQADGKTGEGFLEGSMKDYETPSITQHDCKFSVF